MSRFTRIMFVMAALLLMFSSAFAYDTRMETLGNVPYWKDAGDVDMWFGEIANYGDMVWLNFNGYPNNLDGFTLTKNEEVFGTYYISFGGATDMTYMTDEKISLGYGYSLDVASIGVMFRLYENADLEFVDNDNDGIDDDGAEASKFDFGAGVDLDLIEGMNIDGAFMFGKTGDDTSMGFGARAFVGGIYKEDLELVPAFMFHTATMAQTAVNNPGDPSDDLNEDLAATMMMFGLGFAYTVNDDNTLILGFDYMKSTMEKFVDTNNDGLMDAVGEDEDTTMPGFYLGMEHDVNDWLTVRAAGHKAWMKDQDDNESYPFMPSFGFGVHLGDFDLDLSYNSAQIFDTFNWFMGGDANLGVTGLQIKYYF